MTQNFYDKVAQKFGGYGYGNGAKPRYKRYLAEGKVLEKNLKELQALSFKVIFAENFHYFEYYPSYEDMLRNFQPIKALCFPATDW